MPLGELVFEAVVQPLLEIVLQGAGYLTGRVVVPLLSLGRASVEPAPKGVRVRPRWHGLHRGSHGKVVVDAELGALFGLLFWLVMGVVARVVG